MSLNLHCKEVDLWQTPTHITMMCYSNNDGGWEGIRYRYLQWVASHTNGVWKNPQDLADEKTRVKEHTDRLMSKKSLTFSIV